MVEHTWAKGIKERPEIIQMCVINRMLGTSDVERTFFLLTGVEIGYQHASA